MAHPKKEGAPKVDSTQLRENDMGPHISCDHPLTKNERGIAKVTEQRRVMAEECNWTNMEESVGGSPCDYSYGYIEKKPGNYGCTDDNCGGPSDDPPKCSKEGCIAKGPCIPLE